VACWYADDIAMGALDGTPGERTRAPSMPAFDLVLHCNGVMAEMAEIIGRPPRPVSAGGLGADRARRRLGRLARLEDFGPRQGGAARRFWAELMTVNPNPVARP